MVDKPPKRKKARKSVRTKHSTEQAMWKILHYLLRDFRAGLGDKAWMDAYDYAYKHRDVSVVRQQNLQMEGLDWLEFKCQYQAHSLFKRFRMSKDIYSESELESKTLDKFGETQERISRVNLTRQPDYIRQLLSYAREYVAEILGPYDPAEHLRACRFGKRATVGVPLAVACEAQRWELPISGTRAEVRWFLDNFLPGRPSCQNYLHGNGDTQYFHLTEALKLTLVPKSYKSLRSIMPNTTLGSFLSSGLGTMLRRRLKRNGYDISVLQHKHRSLAREASLRDSYVTADLSAASDSITEQLIGTLFPKEWKHAFDEAKSNWIDWDEISTKPFTYCFMGSGYTFPLQTLVFLSLIQACNRKFHMGCAMVSVYGDDLIYSKALHVHVCDLLAHAGFVLNSDKTFSHGPFRESCGGDYYHGRDVRPYQPEGLGSVMLRSNIEYEAFLYKAINGLKARWPVQAIPNTLKYLLSEIAHLGRPYVVPIDYPDYAGIQVATLADADFAKAYRPDWPKHVGHAIYRFRCLGQKPILRKEDRHEPYVWTRLTGRDDDGDHNDRNIRRQVVAGTFLRELLSSMERPEPSLTWKQSQLRRCLTCLKVSPMDKLKCEGGKLDTVPCRKAGGGASTRAKSEPTSYVAVHCDNVRYARQSGTSCFEDRRLTV